MVDPKDITKFDRDPRELEEFWLFCLLVGGGKNADNCAAALSRLVGQAVFPFAYLQLLDKDDLLLPALKECRTGQYTRLGKSIRHACDCLQRNQEYLSTATAEQLELTPGVGCKTSRFFILHSRADYRVAVLDTHIRQWMKVMGSDIPQQPPRSKEEYLKYEQECLLLFDTHYPSLSVAETDLHIWSMNSGRTNPELPL